MKVGTRFIVALLMVLLPVMGAYMYWSVHRSTQSYIHDLERESRATARSLGAALDDDIRTNEWDQVDDVLERIRIDGTEAAVFADRRQTLACAAGLPGASHPAARAGQMGGPTEPLEFRLDADPAGEWICHVVPLGPPKFPPHRLPAGRE